MNHCLNAADFLIRRMKCVTLSPRISASVGAADRKTGRKTGAHGFSVSFTVTLYHAVLILAAAVLALRAAMLFCRIKREKKLRSKFRRKLRKMRKK